MQGGAWNANDKLEMPLNNFQVVELLESDTGEEVEQSRRS